MSPEPHNSPISLEPDNLTSSSEPAQASSSDQNNPIDQPECNGQAPRTSLRNRKPPSHLQDYHCFLTTNDKPSKHPLSKYLSYDKLSSNHKNFSFALSSLTEPSSYKEAVQEQ